MSLDRIAQIGLIMMAVGFVLLVRLEMVLLALDLLWQYHAWVLVFSGFVLIVIAVYLEVLRPLGEQ